MGAIESVFNWPVRVYYEDTDAGGVVYHSQYLNFCERARTEWLRALGIEQTELLTEFGVIFVVHSLEASYHFPAKFNDALDVKSTVRSKSAASIVFEQTILREDQVLFTAQVKVACVNQSKQKAVKIPRNLSERINDIVSTK